MKYLLIVLVLVIVGCSASTPAIPDRTDIIGKHYEGFKNWAVEATTLLPAFISPKYCASGENINLTYVISDDFIYNKFFIWNENQQNWEQRNFQGDTQISSWILKSGQGILSGTCEEIKKYADNNNNIYAAGYSCKKEPQGFDCYGNKWQIDISQVILCDDCGHKLESLPIKEIRSYSYNGIEFNAYVDIPNSDVDIIVAYHGTVPNEQVDAKLFAENFVRRLRDNNVFGEEYGIFSIAYPQHGDNRFLFGDGYDVAEAGLLWAKNNIFNEFNLNRGKLFTMGHSQGGYVVTRLNAKHQVDGVIANAPGPIDLSTRCANQALKHGRDVSMKTCSDLEKIYGSARNNPQPYIERSMISFADSQKSPILFIQGLDDSQYQINNLKKFEEKKKDCIDCAKTQFEYISNVGHSGIIDNENAKKIANVFLNNTENLENPPNTTPILVLPIDFYCYSFEQNPSLDCTLTRNDVEILLKETNKIWEQADIKWTLNSYQQKRASIEEFSTTSSDTIQQIQQKLVRIAPQAKNKTWNVMGIKKFPEPIGAAGLYIPGFQILFYAENSRNGPSENFILAHELAHALSLNDLAETVIVGDLISNLMGRDAANTDSPVLTEDQIERVRSQAVIGPAGIEDMEGGQSYGVGTRSRNQR